VRACVRACVCVCVCVCLCVCVCVACVAMYEYGVVCEMRGLDNHTFNLKGLQVARIVLHLCLRGTGQSLNGQSFGGLSLRALTWSCFRIPTWFGLGLREEGELAPQPM